MILEVLRMPALRAALVPALWLCLLERPAGAQGAGPEPATAVSTQAAASTAPPGAVASEEAAFRLCVSSYTPEKILSAYGTAWGEEWLADWRAWEFYIRLAEVNEHRSHLAKNPAPCESLRPILTSTAPMQNAGDWCRGSYDHHRFVWSVLREGKPDWEACRAAYLSEGDITSKESGRLQDFCAGYAGALRTGDPKAACSRLRSKGLPKALRMKPGEFDRWCIENMGIARGDFEVCASTAPRLGSGLERAECDAGVGLVRALRIALPPACAESALCSFLADPTETPLRAKEGALVETFCRQMARWEGGGRRAPQMPLPQVFIETPKEGP